jgi:Fe-S cluster assembly protein SufD
MDIGRLSHYARLRDQIGERDPQWLRSFRDRALARFEELGFPVPSDEEWRFTPIGPIAETPFETPPAAAEAGTDRVFADAGFARLVFIDGVFSRDRSELRGLPRNVEICSLKDAIVRHPELVEPWLGHVAAGGSGFSALNGALMADGGFVSVPAGEVVETPVLFEFISTSHERPVVVSPRLLVLLGESSSLTLIETYRSPNGAANLTNSVAEIAVGANASLEHYRLQQESASGYHVGRTAVILERDSRYSSHSVAIGGAIARHDLGAVLRGENGLCTMNGLYIGRDRQLLDNHTVIDHAVAHCESHELYKGILNDRAHGVFNGKVYVRPDAQKTDAKQTNQVLLLSDGARIDTKPQLEIFADDVRCTHGATVGQLDADGLFYLRSRGIALDDARNVLIHAFASDIIDRMALAAVRTHLENALLESLPKPSAMFWDLGDFGR